MLHSRVPKFALLLVLLAVAGCGPRTPVTPAGGNQSKADLEAPVGARVSITAAGFEPRSVTVRVGQSVVWSNADTRRHNVGGSGLVSGPLEPGATYTHAFDQPGTYQYLCTFHPEDEEGMVVVEP